MGRSRGQVILIAALGIAVTLVALALVTNTVIYTENLATRETVDGQQAVAVQQATQDGVGGLLSLANRYNTSNRHARFDADVANFSNATQIAATRNGHVQTATITGTTDGARIFQNASRNFTDVNGNETWTLATGVSNTRRFELNVTQSKLDSTNPFTVTVGGDYSATIAPEGSDVINLTVTNDTVSKSCEVTATHAVVDLTEGTLNGTDCPVPAFASDVGAPYDITFSNAQNGYGRYVLFVDQQPSSLPTAHYAGSYSNDPNYAPAIYDATVHVQFVTQDLTYETNVTVAPEDSPEGEAYGVVP